MTTTMVMGCHKQSKEVRCRDELTLRFLGFNDNMVRQVRVLGPRPEAAHPSAPLRRSPRQLGPLLFLPPSSFLPSYPCLSPALLTAPPPPPTRSICHARHQSSFLTISPFVSVAKLSLPVKLQWQMTPHFYPSLLRLTRSM